MRIRIFGKPFAITKLAEDRWVDYRVRKILTVDFGKSPKCEWEQTKLTRLHTFLTTGKIDAGATTNRFIMLVMSRDSMKHACALTLERDGIVKMYDSGVDAVLYTNKDGRD